MAEDAGLYAVVATNAQGETHSAAELHVVANAAILGDVQHEASWQKIQALEAPRGVQPMDEVTHFSAKITCSRIVSTVLPDSRVN